MTVLEYFSCDHPEHWQHQIKKTARAENKQNIYISTNHIGLYEKYGCEFYRMMNDIHGEPSRVYKKHISENKQTK